MKTILIISSLLFLVQTGYLQAQMNNCPDDHQALSPEPLDEEWAREWWLPRHRDKLQEPGKEDARLLFIGDSITQGWEDEGRDVWDEYFADFGAFNLGFSGDRTENVLWRIENGELDGLQPTVTVLMIGTNNTGHRQDPPGCVERGIATILEEIKEKLPETRILLLSILPRGETPDDPHRKLNSEINDRIRPMADDRKVHFLDINDVFVDEDGNLLVDLMPDRLHPNEKGYRTWAEAMHGTLIGMLEE